VKHARFLIVGVIVLALGACATVPSRGNPENGAIYGYFDIPKDTLGQLSDIALFHYPVQVKPYIGFATDLHSVIVGGAFFAYDAAPGKYFIQRVVAKQPSSLLSAGAEYSLELVHFGVGGFDEANRAAMEKSLITVKPGQLVYAGAQGISIEKKPGFLSKGAFSTGPINSPTEKEVLEKLMPALKDTPWEQSVKDRIESLK